MRVGPVDLKRSVKSLAFANGTVWAPQEIIQGRPKRQAVGEESQDVTLKCHLHQALIGVQDTWNALEELRSGEDTVLLQFDNGLTWGPYVIMKNTMTPTSLLPDETILAVDLDIALGDPGALADEDVAPAPVAVTGSPAAKTADATEDRSTPPADVTAQQIARRP